MKDVGVREFKEKLSAYLEEVEKGQDLRITKRGQVIALLIPSARAGLSRSVWRLVDGGAASWSGRKPSGAAQPLKVPGRPLSELVLEDRL